MSDDPSHRNDDHDPQDGEGSGEEHVDSPLSLEAERARAIAEVLADQAAKEQVRKALRRRPGTTVPRIVAMAVLAAASLYAWFWSPAFLDPPPAPPITMEHEQASLRLAMYIQAQRIEAFRRERGRLPDVLEEVGEPLPGMRYDRMDARSYRLRGTGTRTTFLYESGDSLAAWAGDAARILGISP